MEDLANRKISDFDQAYFIQSRKEIDTEKQERDKLLHFAILFLVGILVAAVQIIDKLLEISPVESLLIVIPLLAIITAMFWIRWKKLRQIADRWYTLYHLLDQGFGSIHTKPYLERVVINRFKERSYIKKDQLLNFCLCSPLYLYIGVGCYNLFSTCKYVLGLVYALVIITHFFISLIILGRWMKDPYEDERS